MNYLFKKNKYCRNLEVIFDVFLTPEEYKNGEKD